MASNIYKAPLSPVVLAVAVAVAVAEGPAAAAAATAVPLAWNNATGSESLYTQGAVPLHLSTITTRCSRALDCAALPRARDGQIPPLLVAS